MKLLLSISLVLYCCIATGCLSTKVTSLVDLAYKDSSYGRILVIGNYPKIEQLRSAEKHMVKHLQDSGIYAISNSELLPPLRKYSDSEISAVYAKYDLDACIVISPTGEKSESIFIPGSTFVNSEAGHTFSGTTLSTTVHSGGGTTKKEITIDTKAELRDIKTGALVCQCETISEKTDYQNSFFNSDADDVMNQICEEMAIEFRKNKVIRKK